MMKSIAVSYGTDLEEALFLERPNRFLIRCVLKDSGDANGVVARGSVLEAHLPDPGRLKELLIPGQKVWLRAVNNPKRKTKWSAVLCERPGGAGLVSLDSTLPNRLIARALAEGAMEEFKGWSLVRAEFKMGHSRWDFLLSGRDERQLVLEVKSVTLVEDGVGLFPDAITARGAKHLRELAQIAQRHGWEAAVLFVMQREDASRIEAAHSIDPNFAEALAEAKAAGVSAFGRSCRITLKEIILEDRVPVS